MSQLVVCELENGRTVKAIKDEQSFQRLCHYLRYIMIVAGQKKQTVFITLGTLNTVPEETEDEDDLSRSFAE